jgi:rubrerythrin
MKRETHAHFERLAEEAENGELKQLFSLLAAAESEHIDTLLAADKSMSTRDVEGLKDLDASVCVYSPNIDQWHLDEALKNDPDAYRHVVQEEEQSIEFFDQLSDQAASEKTRKVFQLLAAKEREHLEMLENIYFFVEEPRTYLEWGEFSNLKSL